MQLVFRGHEMQEKAEEMKRDLQKTKEELKRKENEIDSYKKIAETVA